MENALENRSISVFNKHMELFIYLLGSQLMVNLDHLCVLHSGDSKAIWIAGNSEKWNLK